MADLDAILARLELVEKENEALRGRLKDLEAGPDTGRSGLTRRVSRRVLLRRAGGSAAALGVGALGASLGALSLATPARATDGQAITVGGNFDATSPTVIHNTSNANSVLIATSKSSGAIEGNSTSGTGVRGESDSGVGIFGNSDSAAGALGKAISGPGVHGISNTGDGVLGESTSGVAVRGRATDGDAIVGETIDGSGVSGQASGAGTAVRGSSTAGYGVYGQSGSSIGVSGLSGKGIGAQGAGKDIGVAGASVSGPNAGQGTGVLGISGYSTFPDRAKRTDIGVMGVSAHGRGGVFTGPTAQVQLLASSAVSHPATGVRGDLFVDKSGRLWFCKGGTSWRQLA